MESVEATRTGVQTGIATIAAQAQVDAADKHRQGMEKAAEYGKDGQVESADKKGGWDFQSAQEMARAQVDAADKHRQGTEKAAEFHKDGMVEQAGATRDAADSQAAGQVGAAGATAGAHIHAANMSKEASNHAADKGFDGVELRENFETARLRIKLGWADARWADIFPVVRDALGRDAQVGGGGVPWAGLIAAVGAAPSINVTGILTPQQVRRQVNAIHARSAAKALAAIARSERDLAGRGFASSSPVLAMLRRAHESDASREAVEGEVELTTKAAQSNAEMMLKGQEALSEQHGRMVTAYTALSNDMVQLRVGLFSGAANLLAGIV
jgi:hypothetical protein